MKHIKAAWIEQLIVFDSDEEVNSFIKALTDKKKQYYVISQNGSVLRIRIQYNNNSMDMEEGE